MAIKTNMTELTPRRERFKREIQLLSGGYTDRQAFPSGMITIYPWDSSIDAWFQDRAMKGRQDTIFIDLFQKLCNLNGCPVDKFVSGDVFTVLMVSRALRTQNTLSYVAKCPACGHAESEKIVVPDELEKVGEKSLDYPGYDDITLPVCKDDVRISPLLVGQERSISESNDQDKMPNQLARVLYSIQLVGGGEPESIDEALEWYQALDPQDLDYLETQINEHNPHLDQEIHHKCDKCGEEFSHTLALDQEFFRPSHRAVADSKVAKHMGAGDGQQGNGGGAAKFA